MDIQRYWYDISVPWLPGIRAITLYPLCLYLGDAIDAPCTRAHEHYHRQEALRYGVILWYLWYVVLAVFNIGKPADQHPMEREAYRLSRECEAQGQ